MESFQLINSVGQQSNNSTHLKLKEDFKTSFNENKISYNSTKYYWTSIIIKQFENNNSSTDDSNLKKKGFVSLKKSLGLFKRSNKTKEINGTTIKCFSENEIYHWYQNASTNGLTKEQFAEVCPTLLLQIHFRICKTVSSNQVIAKDYSKIWLYSSCSVLLCSLIGLLVVWLIPIIPKTYYNSISQLLIALAVGSLTGDALLHLIPHALLDGGSGHNHDFDKGHSKTVWKALAAYIGIHLFFLTERITILCQNLKSKSKSKYKEPHHDHVNAEWPSGEVYDDTTKIGIHSTINGSSQMNIKHWTSKSRTCSGNGDRDLHTDDNHFDLKPNLEISEHESNGPKNKSRPNAECLDSIPVNIRHPICLHLANEDSHIGESLNLDKEPYVNGNVNGYIVPTVDILGYKSLFKNNLVNIEKKEGNLSSNEDEELLLQTPTEDLVKIDALTHPNYNKPHGHHHGHSHDLSSVKAIAYTVIAGDGLHNFCDGIAIGAAFANDLGGGLSTAIAVLCHELPHELGDFVVLLHAGMSFKTAIFYNLLSSIFCAAGMVIGVSLGAVPSVSSWIFMITAGMFLYIALVDLMPELSTHRLQGHKVFHRPSVLFVWQNIGLLLGALIMLFIALYEGKML